MRCAIYTRKSTDDGLEQEFNSLDAQREAAEAYITSQKGIGWECLPDRYDDGGFTGGNTDRPALKKLLADIEEGKIDCVVVYKVDRLSRSLLDFARLIDMFEKHNVIFVAVTQQFSTSNSMGRLTLNILLSFAQFEREIIAERTKDKMSASRKKGKWVGGIPFLGYDIASGGGRLVVNQREAEMVRAIFKLYIATESMTLVLKHLNERNWRTKEWTTLAGVKRGGKPFSKNMLYKIIGNVSYIGKIDYEGQLYNAEHDAIVSVEDFEKAREILRHHYKEAKTDRKNKHGELLRGLLRCGKCGCMMTQRIHQRDNRMYRYYVCPGGKDEGCDSKSLVAPEVENLVVRELRCAIQRAGMESEVYDAFKVQCAEKEKMLDLEEKMLSGQVERLGNEAAAAMDRQDMETWEAAKTESAKAEQELVKIIRQKRTLKGELPTEKDVSEIFGQWETMWESMDVFDRANIVHQFIQKIDYDSAKGSLAISYEIK